MVSYSKSTEDHKYQIPRECLTCTVLAGKSSCSVHWAIMSNRNCISQWNISLLNNVGNFKMITFQTALWFLTNLGNGTTEVVELAWIWVISTACSRYERQTLLTRQTLRTRQTLLTIIDYSLNKRNIDFPGIIFKLISNFVKFWVLSLGYSSSCKNSRMLKYMIFLT